jgi:hypothetical protein
MAEQKLTVSQQQPNEQRDEYLVLRHLLENIVVVLSIQI